jgi:hypothetical protein
MNCAGQVMGLATVFLYVRQRRMPVLPALAPLKQLARV